MTEAKRLVFFGDSICVGQGVSIHKGWVTRLAAHISDECELRGIEVVVVNASVNGNTTRQALERMPYDVQSHGADLLIVQFGMNDGNYWASDRGIPRVSLQAFAANLEEIVQRAYVFGARNVYLLTNHPTSRNFEVFPHTNVTYQESNSRYNDAIRQVCGKLQGKAVLIDIESHFNALMEQNKDLLRDLLLADRIHLSERGHDIYFRAISPLIDVFLDEISQPLSSS